MATLTPEQRQDIRKAGEEPVRLADPATQTEYVIIKADVYGFGGHGFGGHHIESSRQLKGTVRSTTPRLQAYLGVRPRSN